MPITKQRISFLPPSSENSSYVYFVYFVSGMPPDGFPSFRSHASIPPTHPSTYSDELNAGVLLEFYFPPAHFYNSAGVLRAHFVSRNPTCYFDDPL
jgi:hypothetical protein